MPDVYAWPPVAAVAWRTSLTRPGSLSYNQAGAPYYSQAQAARQTFDVQILGKGPTDDGTGLIEMLIRKLDGKMPLVRVYPLPPLWWKTALRLNGLRGRSEVLLTDGGRTVDVNDGGITVNLFDGGAISATYGADGDWDSILCTGLPASQPVAYPGEIVRAETGETARVLKREVSNANGAARIRLDGPLPSGDVTIGALESMVMLITKWPDYQQGVDPESLQFSMREVFASDFDEAFTEHSPW